jgi:hypothetical protein
VGSIDGSHRRFGPARPQFANSHSGSHWDLSHQAHRLRRYGTLRGAPTSKRLQTRGLVHSTQFSSDLFSPFRSWALLRLSPRARRSAPFCFLGSRRACLEAPAAAAPPRRSPNKALHLPWERGRLLSVPQDAWDYKLNLRRTTMYMDQLTIIGLTSQDAEFHFTPNRPRRSSRGAVPTSAWLLPTPQKSRRSMSWICRAVSWKGTSAGKPLSRPWRPYSPMPNAGDPRVESGEFRLA